MRISQKRYAAYEKKAGKEIICTREGTYNVTLAWYLVEEDDRDVELVDVEAEAKKCGFDHQPVEERDGCLIFQRPDGGRTVIDREHWLKELDLEKPLLFDRENLIDGLHRLYRAFMLGRATLLSQSMTAEEKKYCFSRRDV